MKKPRSKRESVAFDPVDVHVGKRVRIRRKLSGISQTALGDMVGLTFQQIQKYERGANRIGASRLYEIAQALDVPVSFFFDEMPEGLVGRRAAKSVVVDLHVMKNAEAQDLLRAYYRIENKTVRDNLFQLAKTLARAVNG